MHAALALTPHDGAQAEDLAGDGADAVVDVALRRTVERGQQTRLVHDDLVENMSMV
jgi:hypothetical protein